MSNDDLNQLLMILKHQKGLFEHVVAKNALKNIFEKTFTKDNQEYFHKIETFFMIVGATERQCNEIMNTLHITIGKKLEEYSEQLLQHLEKNNVKLNDIKKVETFLENPQLDINHDVIKDHIGNKECVDKINEFIISINRDAILHAFGQLVMVHFDKRSFRDRICKNKEMSDVLKHITNEWSSDKPMYTVLENIKKNDLQRVSAREQTNQFNILFQIKNCTSIDYRIFHQDIKSFFISYTKSVLKEATVKNRNNYVQRKNEQRFQSFYHKAQMKSQMSSIKQIKAVWYHGLNKHHQIMPNDTLSISHITAIICYSDNSTLCTSFRETFRSKGQNETIEQQKNRHQEFRHIGKLLYESFVFFGNTDGKIKTLYHGISIPLLF
eukprot:531503_1